MVEFQKKKKKIIHEFLFLFIKYTMLNVTTFTRQSFLIKYWSVPFILEQ